MASGKHSKKSRAGKKRTKAGQKRPKSIYSKSKNGQGCGLANLRSDNSDIVSLMTLYKQKQFSNICRDFGDFEYSYFENEEDRHIFLVLMTFAYANQSQYDQAERMAAVGVEQYPDDRDFHYVLAFVNTAYKNYAVVIQSTDAFFRHADTDQSTFGLSYNLDHLVCNFQGLAFKALKKYQQALDSFKKAIKYDSGYEHAYLNMVNLLISQNKVDEGLVWLEKGLKNCRQVQELRLMKKNLENRATISACMIVKNEEELLGQCLNSIRNWVDEIIIVDTGSTDRTVEIAKEYGAKVYFREWDNDFSAPRNLSIEKAKSEWIFIIDADEEFVEDDVSRLRQAISETDAQLISINVDNINPKTGETSSGLISVRLFKNSPEFYYDGIVHNQLRYPENLTALAVPVTIKHYGYNLSLDKMRRKLNRSRKLLEKQLEEKPDFAFAHFNMAQLLRSVSEEDEPGIHDKVIHHARRVIELTDKTLGIHLQAHHQAAFACMKKSDFNTAEEYLKKALEIKPDYLDAVFTMGQILIARREYRNAEKWLNRYLEIQQIYDHKEHTDNVILMYLRARHTAHYYIGLIKSESGHKDEALEHFKRVLIEQFPYRDTYLRMANIYLDLQQPGQAVYYSDKELEINPQSDQALLYKGAGMMLLNDTKQAEELFAKALEYTSDNPEVLNKAGCYMAGSGRFDLALDAFNRLISINPENSEYRYLKARAAYDAEMHELAIEAFADYLEFVPDNAECRNDLANCYYRLEDYEKAEVEFTMALDKNSNLAVSYRNLGLTKIKLNKNKEALALLVEYLKAAPEDFSIISAVADLYMLMGEYNNAIQYIEKYLQQFPENPDALFKISECYFNLGHFPSAQIGYRQLLKSNPDFAPAIDRLNEIESIINQT